jgi:hypothetical protein
VKRVGTHLKKAWVDTFDGIFVGFEMLCRALGISKNTSPPYTCCRHLYNSGGANIARAKWSKRAVETCCGKTLGTKCDPSSAATSRDTCLPLLPADTFDLYRASYPDGRICSNRTWEKSPWSTTNCGHKDAFTRKCGPRGEIVHSFCDSRELGENEKENENWIFKSTKKLINKAKTFVSAKTKKAMSFVATKVTAVQSGAKKTLLKALMPKLLNLLPVQFKPLGEALVPCVVSSNWKGILKTVQAKFRTLILPSILKMILNSHHLTVDGSGPRLTPPVVVVECMASQWVGSAFDSDYENFIYSKNSHPSRSGTWHVAKRAGWEMKQGRDWILENGKDCDNQPANKDDALGPLHLVIRRYLKKNERTLSSPHGDYTTTEKRHQKDKLERCFRSKEPCVKVCEFEFIADMHNCGPANEPSTLNTKAKNCKADAVYRWPRSTSTKFGPEENDREHGCMTWYMQVNTILQTIFGGMSSLLNANCLRECS